MSTVAAPRPRGGWTQREEKPRQGSLLGNQHELLVCTNGHPRFTFTEEGAPRELLSTNLSLLKYG